MTDQNLPPEPQPPYGTPQQPPSSPYGAAQPSPYGGTPPAGAPQGGYPMAPPNHPQAMLVLILGILGLVVCGLCAPFAWVMGNRVVREIDSSGGAYGGRDSANIGRILGIIGSVLIIVGIVLVIGLLIFGGLLASTSSSTGVIGSHLALAR